MQELKSSKYFNSRPREEVEAASGILNAKYLVFQLTISRRGRRLLLTNQFRCRNYFNSRPHKEIDQSGVQEKLENQVFQLTTSQGGRRYCSKVRKKPNGISTHDLARRSTNIQICLSYNKKHFNSRPRKEVDNHSLFLMPLQMHFNSRPRKEVDAGDAASDATDKLFQLTTSQGGRQSLTIPDAFADAFQLTTSQGGRRMRQQVSLNYIAISTHDLARRSTAF